MQTGDDSDAFSAVRLGANANGARPDEKNVNGSTPETLTAIVETSSASAESAIIVRKTPQTNAVDVYLRTLGSDRSRQTVREALQRALRLLGESDKSWRLAPWHRIGVDALSKLLAALTSPAPGAPIWSPATQKLTWGIVKTVLRTCYRLGHMTPDRWQQLSAVLETRIRGSSPPPGRMLEAKEIHKLREWCERAPSLYGAQAWAILSLMLGGGLRREEVSKLTVDDLSDDARGVYVHGKGGKRVVQPVRPGVGAAVEAWLALRERHVEKRAAAGYPLHTRSMFLRISGNMRTVHDEGLSPWLVWDVLSLVQKQAGVRHFTPHDLRRTFGSVLLREAPLVNVQRLMRHSDPRTTARYDRRPMEEVSEALKVLDSWWGAPAEEGPKEPA